MNNMNNTENIDVKKLVLKSIFNSKWELGGASVMLLISIWCGDVTFYEGIGKITKNVTEYINNFDTHKKALAYLVFIYAMSNLLHYANNNVISTTFPDLELRIIRDIVDESIFSVMTEKTQFNVNEYIMNIRKVAELKILYSFAASYIIPTIVVAFGILWHFKSSGKYLWMVITLFVCMILFTIYMEVNNVSSAQQNEKELNVFFDDVQDVINNTDTVTVNNSYKYEIDRINEKKHHVVSIKSKNDSEESFSLLQLNMLCFASFIALICITGMAYKDKKLAEETVVSLGLISLTYMQYYESLVSKFRGVSDKFGKLTEVQEYFSKFKFTDDNHRTKMLNVTNGNIYFKNITIKYDDKTVLKNSSFKIHGGKITGIIGDIGSGKTSIFKALIGLIKYDGNIYVDNQDIYKCKHGSIISKITFIPQHPKLFNNTIYYNISYGTGLTRNNILKVLNKIGMRDFFNSFPKGLDTPVGKEGNKLSGGQKQMMALARAIIQNKKVMLLDEPTSSLDPHIKKLMINIITSLKEKTIIIIAHDGTLIDIFDDVINFNELNKN
jgi:ATP-binding cassette, subfamily C, bacterial